MKAMLLRRIAPVESTPLALVDLPIPEPGPGEVRIQVRCCAVCRTDLHVIEGDLPEQKMPVIPGHQIVGTVDKLGPPLAVSQAPLWHGLPTVPSGGSPVAGLARSGDRATTEDKFGPATGAEGGGRRAKTRLEIGQRVGVAWLRHTCGRCAFCTRGQENLCESARFTGYHADGGYAEYAVAPADFVYELPEAFGDVDGAPLSVRRHYRLSGAAAVQSAAWREIGPLWVRLVGPRRDPNCLASRLRSLRGHAGREPSRACPADGRRVGR